MKLRKAWSSATFMATGILVASCGSSHSAGSASTTTLPAIAATAGQPKAVSSAGATATVTVNGVRYAPIPGGDSQSELAVVDLTVTGTSAAPFPYRADEVVFSYSDAGSAYTHNDDPHTYGPSMLEDYTPFMPPSPLRVGQVAKGQSARGLVMLRMSPNSPYLLQFDDPSAKPLAEWALHSK